MFNSISNSGISTRANYESINGAQPPPNKDMEVAISEKAPLPESIGVFIR
tara:strand:- start:1349 stop:1498 length:150 start_codon:yes stop_codon:yes gene_type:complete